MPQIDIEIDDILYGCSRHDIKELIQALVEEGHLPKEVLNEKKEVREELVRRGRMEDVFAEKIELLKTKFYSLTEEEESFFEEIFKKYL